jgi:SAM-dependent methyltransferase
MNQNSTKYTELQYQENYPQSKRYHFWDITRNHIIGLELQKYKKRKMLEIGCGTGVVLGYLFEKGFDISGVELGNPIINKNLEKFIIINSSFQDLNLSFRKKVEVILLLDVLEHIKDPSIFLEKIFNSFPKLEMLFITLPARQEIWTNYDEYYGHFLRYDLNSIVELDKVVLPFLPKSEKKYFFHLLYFAILFIKKLKKHRQEETKEILGYIEKLFHRLVSFAFILDYYLFPNKLLGSSLLVKYEKSL